MKRIIDIEKSYIAKNLNEALNKFFKKYPHVEYWRENFEYMEANEIDFDSDNKFADGSDNPDWRWALRLYVDKYCEDKNIYDITVIERI